MLKMVLPLLMFFAASMLFSSSPDAAPFSMHATAAHPVRMATRRNEVPYFVARDAAILGMGKAAERDGEKSAAANEYDRSRWQLEFRVEQRAAEQSQLECQQEREHLERLRRAAGAWLTPPQDRKRYKEAIEGYKLRACERYQKLSRSLGRNGW
mmetsp:Transcript_4185/g.10829  ORF Transcript_4185/g.10829 Transcript_4185/m.10829 type:complete len:154 (+) Transcript_4185:3-464(+)